MCVYVCVHWNTVFFCVCVYICTCVHVCVCSCDAGPGDYIETQQEFVLVGLESESESETEPDPQVMCFDIDIVTDDNAEAAEQFRVVANINPVTPPISVTGSSTNVTIFETRMFFFCILYRARFKPSTLSKCMCVCVCVCTCMYVRTCMCKCVCVCV